jgi:hypothetical protein
MTNESFLVLFFKKEPLARRVGAAAAHKPKTALLFEKRSKNFFELTDVTG